MALCCLISYFSEGIKYILGWWNFFCFPHHICFFCGVCACTCSFLHVRGSPQVSGELWLFKNERWREKKMIGNCTWVGLVTWGTSSSLIYICRSVLMSGSLAVGKGWWDFTEQALTQPPVFSRVPHPCPQLCWESTLPEGTFSVSCPDMQGREENMGTYYSLHIFLQPVSFPTVPGPNLLLSTPEA